MRLLVVAASMWALTALTLALSVRDDGTELAKQNCRRRFSSPVDRKACFSDYIDQKSISTSASAAAHAVEQQRLAAACAEPSDVATPQEKQALDQCLHGRERGTLSDLLYRHLLESPTLGDAAAAIPMTAPTTAASLRRGCLVAAGDANWTSAGLADDRPECGRRWMRTGAARRLFSGHDLLFIGNSVVRRQMYTIADVLAGPAARRLRGRAEIVPTQLVPDHGVLSDAALLTQEGVLNTRITQVRPLFLMTDD